jgi:hypothetical protein
MLIGSNTGNVGFTYLPLSSPTCGNRIAILSFFLNDPASNTIEIH